MQTIVPSSLRRRLRVHLSILGTTLSLFALLGCAKEADYEKQYKWGFRNIQNEVVIDPQYDSVRPFSQGLAAVYSEGEGWGYIDKAGATIIPMQYDEAGIFNKDGLAVVKPRGELEKKYREEEVHYVNRSGNTVLALKGQRAGNFHNGVAWVRKYIGRKRSGTIPGSSIRMARSSPVYSWGLIDKSGNYLVPHIEDLDDKRRIWDVEPWSDGLSVIRRDRTGYMNTAGEMVIPCRYEYAHSFSHGRAFVKSGNDIWSVIDRKGRTLFAQLPGGVKFKPTGKGIFTNHLAPVTWTRDNAKYIAYINSRGKFAFPTDGMRLHRIRNYREGLAQVEVQTDGLSEKIGFIDVKGTWVIDPAFALAGDFHVVDRGKRYKERKRVAWAIPWFEYNFWDVMSDLGVAILGMHEKTAERKFGYIDSSGDWIIQPETTVVHNARRNKAESMSAVDQGLYDFSEGLVAFPSIAP